MRRIAIVVVLVAAAAGIAGATWWYWDRDANRTELELYGNVDLRQVDLAFNNSQRVAEVLVEEGDRVERGQVVARLDTNRLKPQMQQAEAELAAQRDVVERMHRGSRPEEIAQARANLRSAQADAANAARQYERLKLLTEQSSGGAVSQQELDNAQATQQVTDARVDVAQATLNLAVAGPREEEVAEAESRLRGYEARFALLSQELEDAQLTSPVDATVRTRIMEPGEMASPQRPVLQLAVTDPKWVRAYVSEPDLGKVRPGMSALVGVDSFPERRFDGWVGFISPVAEFTPKPVQTEELRTSLVYEVRVYVKDPQNELRLGMPATVHLALDAKAKARPAPKTKARRCASRKLKHGKMRSRRRRAERSYCPPPLGRGKESKPDEWSANRRTRARRSRGGQNLPPRARRDRSRAGRRLAVRAPGAITALVGPDGAGKTTLLRLTAGLLTADSGTLTVLGIDVKQDPQNVQNRIGYMPQRFGLYEDLSVAENLNLYADLHGVTAAQRRERYPRLMEMTALRPFADRLAGRLSGGMKQKLGLACTLVRSPELLLLDEPTVGVDPLSRRELWAIIQQLTGEQHLSVLLSTAYLDEAQRCDDAIVLHQGQILMQAAPAEVSELAAGKTYLLEPRTDQPARELQAALLAEPDVVDAVPEGGRVRMVLADKADNQAVLRSVPHEASETTTPRFEDGFMILLRKVDSDRAESRLLPLEHPPQEANGSAVVEVHDLVRKFGSFTAVDHLSFEVRQGEVFGLLGPNGAGKTTTFRMLCGLLPATAGKLRVAGADLRMARASARQRIGYVAQKFSLYAQLSVLENIEFFCGAYGLRGKRRRERVNWALDQFELRPFANLPSGQLPGGYKQRLAMAVALVHEPAILFLDEPTSGVDPLARREFWQRITSLAAQGVTVIVTTHFMVEAEYCDRVAILDAGKILAQGTPSELRAPRQRAVGQRAHDGRRLHRGGRGIAPRARRRQGPRADGGGSQARARLALDAPQDAPHLGLSGQRDAANVSRCQQHRYRHRASRGADPAVRLRAVVGRDRHSAGRRGRRALARRDGAGLRLSTLVVLRHLDHHLDAAGQADDARSHDRRHRAHCAAILVATWSTATPTCKSWCTAPIRIGRASSRPTPRESSALGGRGGRQPAGRLRWAR